MARIKMGFEAPPRKADRRFVERLVEELKSDRISGQPFIYEDTFSTGKVRVLVVWDDWKDLALEQRTAVIHSAIEQTDGKEYRAKVALASGLTMPEAVASGMLPCQIITALRKSDPVTWEQCRVAMLAEGASQLFGPGELQLRFPTDESAEACRQRLIRMLPCSSEVWIVRRDLSARDFETSHEPAVLETV